jgi:hypothetical protein
MGKEMIGQKDGQLFLPNHFFASILFVSRTLL